MLSPLKGEVERIIKKNRVGITYKNSETLYKSIVSLVSQTKLKSNYSRNAKKLYNKKFEFKKVYDNLVFNLQNLVDNNER